MAGAASAKTRGACHRAALCADPLALLPGYDDVADTCLSLQAVEIARGISGLALRPGLFLYAQPYFGLAGRLM
jgi:hypothetical protein